jgi:nicotinate-nucleotide adenylyltransferase
MSRIGLLGGTFDPPHLGHFTVAADVGKALDMDEVWLIPAAIPPHKPERVITDGDLRLEMLRELVREAPIGSGDSAAPIKVSDIEVERGGVSYTVDTLRDLIKTHPADEFFLVMGVDQFVTVSTWKDPEDIGRLATVAVMCRDGLSPPAVAPGTNVRCLPVDVTRMDVSSTQVRERVGRGEHIESLVGAGVARVIAKNGLYGGNALMTVRE